MWNQINVTITQEMIDLGWVGYRHPDTGEEHGHRMDRNLPLKVGDVLHIPYVSEIDIES